MPEMGFIRVEAHRYLSCACQRRPIRTKCARIVMGLLACGCPAQATAHAAHGVLTSKQAALRALELEPEADEKAIKKAYRRLALRFATFWKLSLDSLRSRRF